MRLKELLFALLGNRVLQPGVESGFIELDKDPLPAYFSRWHPGRGLAREGDPAALPGIWPITKLARCINPRKAEQRSHLAESLHQYDTCEGSLKPLWYNH